jgi:hypothetical protein
LIVLDCVRTKEVALLRDGKRSYTEDPERPDRRASSRKSKHEYFLSGAAEKIQIARLGLKTCTFAIS